ncbi:MAG: hypothetical protein DRP97_02945 [Candidatus Latescibacterota bacterium]|nr:MAG: hypothetical protein DRP97_02945 [Candidatus Latescibacterota bacterium]
MTATAVKGGNVNKSNERIIDEAAQEMAYCGRTFLSVRELGTYLRVEEDWIRECVRENTIPYSHIPGYGENCPIPGYEDGVRFRRTEIDRWVKENEE